MTTSHDTEGATEHPLGHNLESMISAGLDPFADAQASGLVPTADYVHPTPLDVHPAGPADHRHPVAVPTTPSGPTPTPPTSTQPKPPQSKPSPPPTARTAATKTPDTPTWENPPLDPLPETVQDKPARRAASPMPHNPPPRKATPRKTARQRRRSTLIGGIITTVFLLVVAVGIPVLIALHPSTTTKADHNPVSVDCGDYCRTWSDSPGLYYAFPATAGMDEAATQYYSTTIEPVSHWSDVGLGYVAVDYDRYLTDHGTPMSQSARVFGYTDVARGLAWTYDLSMTGLDQPHLAPIANPPDRSTMTAPRYMVLSDRHMTVAFVVTTGTPVPGTYGDSVLVILDAATGQVGSVTRLGQVGAQLLGAGSKCFVLWTRDVFGPSQLVGVADTGARWWQTDAGAPTDPPPYLVATSWVHAADQLLESDTGYLAFTDSTAGVRYWTDSGSSILALRGEPIDDRTYDVRAWDMWDDQARWKSSVHLTGAPLSDGYDTLFGATADGVVALDRDSGQVLWTARDPGVKRLLGGGGYLVVAERANGHIGLYSTVTHKLVDGDFGLAQGSIVLGGYSGVLIAQPAPGGVRSTGYDASKTAGAPQWTLNLRGPFVPINDGHFAVLAPDNLVMVYR